MPLALRLALVTADSHWSLLLFFRHSSAICQKVPDRVMLVREKKGSGEEGKASYLVELHVLGPLLQEILIFGTF